MKKNIMVVVYLGLLLVCGTTVANVGVFNGDGFSVELKKTAAVQLLDESVTFTFKGEKISRIYSETPGLNGDHVEVSAIFTLRNLTDSSVTIQVGFPINGEHASYLEYQLSKKSIADSDSVLHEMMSLLDFSAKEASRTVDLRYVAQDKSELYRGIFLWDMTFSPNETKILDVNYRVELSQTWAKTEAIEYLSYDERRRAEEDESNWHYAKDWYGYLTGAYLECFEYVTSTAKSWAGPPGKAKFRANLAEFEKYLFERGIFGQDFYDLWDAEAKADSSKRKPPPSNLTLSPTIITPSGWRDQNGALEWTYDSFPADSNLNFRFLMTMIPHDRVILDSIISGVFGSTPAKEELSDLREIVAAILGIKPSTPCVLDFAMRQIWFASKPWITENELKPEDKLLLDHLADRIAMAK